MCAAVRQVTSPRLTLLSSSHCRLGAPRADTGDADRAPSRERVVEPAERGRPHRACAGRAVDARAGRVVCAAVRRVMSPRLVLSLSHLPARLYQSRHRRRRASDPPNERAVVSTERRQPRRACAGRSVDARARRVVCAAVRRVTSPHLCLSHRRLGSVRADTGDVERAPSRERVVALTERRRPRRACAGRSVDARAGRVVCAAVRRMTSPRLVLSLL